MQTSVIGFPRVGALRELKFTTEKFFKGLVSEQELQELAKDRQIFYFTCSSMRAVN